MSVIVFLVGRGGGLSSSKIPGGHVGHLHNLTVGSGGGNLSHPVEQILAPSNEVQTSGLPAVDRHGSVFVSCRSMDAAEPL